MGPVSSRFVRKTALYRLFLDNQTGVKVIVVVHGVPIGGQRTSRSDATHTPLPVHVYPLAAKQDESVPVPLALPFQCHTRYLTEYERCREPSVLVSAFTVVTIEGAEYVDGYIYVNQVLESLPDFMSNPRLHGRAHRKRKGGSDNSYLNVQITLSDMARRCRFDLPIAQLPFLAMLTNGYAPVPLSAATADPTLPGGGVGVYRPNVMPHLLLQ